MLRNTVYKIIHFHGWIASGCYYVHLIWCTQHFKSNQAGADIWICRIVRYFVCPEEFSSRKPFDFSLKLPYLSVLYKTVSRVEFYLFLSLKICMLEFCIVNYYSQFLNLTYGDLLHMCGLSLLFFNQIKIFFLIVAQDCYCFITRALRSLLHHNKYIRYFILIFTS